jgi:cyclopropane fatty-acyl-phospholipid synthase-like methyltransferase
MPTEISQNAFYQAYERKGQGTALKAKHIRQFTKDFVEASGYRPDQSVLELGCGNGLFLRFLRHIGARDILGIDGDPRVLAELPAELAGAVHIFDFAAFFASDLAQRHFDRIVLFDVLEHFSPEDAATLLTSVSRLLAKDGRIIIRVPNMASPLGMGVQYNDVTHRTAFSPGSIRQVASVAGLVPDGFRAQAYTSWFKEARERLFTSVVSWFLSAPPMIWSANVIAVLKHAPAGPAGHE